MNTESTTPGFVAMIPDGRYVYFGYQSGVSGTKPYYDTVIGLHNASFFPDSASNSREFKKLLETYPDAVIIQAHQVKSLRLGPVRKAPGDNVGTQE